MRRSSWSVRAARSRSSLRRWASRRCRCATGRGRARSTAENAMRDLSISYTRLASCAVDAGDSEAAGAFFQADLRIARQLLDLQPDSADPQSTWPSHWFRSLISTTIPRHPGPRPRHCSPVCSTKGGSTRRARSCSSSFSQGSVQYVHRDGLPAGRPRHGDFSGVESEPAGSRRACSLCEASRRWNGSRQRTETQTTAN